MRDRPGFHLGRGGHADRTPSRRSGTRGPFSCYAPFGQTPLLPRPLALRFPGGGRRRRRCCPAAARPFCPRSRPRAPLSPPGQNTPRKAGGPEAAGSRTQGGAPTKGDDRPAWGSGACRLDIPLGSPNHRRELSQGPLVESVSSEVSESAGPLPVRSAAVDSSRLRSRAPRVLGWYIDTRRATKTTKKI